MSPRAAKTLFVALAGLVDCEGVTNLDVKYNVLEAAADAGGDADAGDPTAADSGGNDLEGCPCDLSQGLACCVSSSRAGPAFCTTDRDRCNSEHGAFYKCFEPDPGTESVCCWSGEGEGAITAYAAECKDDRLTACMKDSHCGGGEAGSCHVVECRGVRVGACGQDPICPP